MTPPGGSRDDDTDSAPRREAVPGQDRAGAPDDAPADMRDGAARSDPQLRAMRAVWLEMRDEDPPDRGLSELLAAARHQAEAMQPRPSAWQRLLAALRRPPLLALATVTVLIAGAVLIGRRIPRDAAPGMSASRDDGAGSAISTPLDHPTNRTRQALERDDALAVPAPQPAAPPPAAPALPPDRGSVGPASPAHHATTTSPPRSTAKAPPGEAPRNDDDRASAGPASADPAPEPAPPPPERVTQLGASAAASGGDSAGGNNTRSFARPPHAEPEAQPSGRTSNDTASGTANDTASGTANSTANNAANNASSPVANGVASPVANGVAPARRPPPAPPRPDAASDPYRQCEAAAGRGDCATVRRLVGQITRTDPGYRARVAKDSPVGKCLAE